MRTLAESILDGDLDVHDEAVFTEQIIPEIIKCAPYTMRNMASEMTIKMENGKRILFIRGESNSAEIWDKIIKVLENYNIYEIRSEGRLRISDTLTGFTISAPFIYLSADFQKDIILTKCDMTCDTLSTIGFNDPKIVCNQCKIKTKSYEIHRTPIEFINSKIIGLNSVYNFLGVISTRYLLKRLGIKCSVFDIISREASSNEEMLGFDPLSKLASIQKITKLPNVYIFATATTFKEYKPALIFKSPHTPIDRQINKATTISEEPIDCANGYQLIFTN